MVFKVILDTNMAMNIAQKRMDIFGQIKELLLGTVEFIVLKPVLEELRKLASGQSKAGREASLALKMIRRCKVVDIDLMKGETVDRLLLRFAVETGGILATGDRQLIARARNANIPLIYLRQRSRLALEGFEPTYQ